ncbi:MAG: zf-HC2 domain-containing protein [Acidobacteriia bacterium]|nr:zf-HC2 domain-containing protein [Terriglobia bacterium]
MLRCDEIDFSAYHDRALDEGELRKIDIHLQYCSTCLTRYGQEVRLVGGLSEIPPIDPPKHFIPHVMYRVRQQIYSQIIPAEERKFSLLTAGYGLTLLTLVVFLGGLQKTFFDVTLGWAQLPLKSMLAVLRTMNTVTESGSQWLSASAPLSLLVVMFATLVAGFALIKLLTRYERLMLEDVHLRVRRGGNDKTF